MFTNRNTNINTNPNRRYAHRPYSNAARAQPYPPKRPSPQGHQGSPWNPFRIRQFIDPYINPFLSPIGTTAHTKANVKVFSRPPPRRAQLLSRQAPIGTAVEEKTDTSPEPAFNAPPVDKGIGMDSVREALEDAIFEEQWERLQKRKEIMGSLFNYRTVASDAVEMQAERAVEHAKRDAEQARLWEQKVEEQARQERLRKFQAENAERVKAQYEELCRIRHLEHAERERQAAQERVEKEREKKKKDAEEIRRFVDEFLKTQRAKMEEMKKRMPPPPKPFQYQYIPARPTVNRPAPVSTAAPASPVDQLLCYETKWNGLRPTSAVVLDFSCIPWPILTPLQSLADLTKSSISAFVFHPQRPGLQGKSHRVRIHEELLRWHPDKFCVRVLDKVIAQDRQIVQEGAEVVVRLLTEMMAEV